MIDIEVETNKVVKYIRSRNTITFGFIKYYYFKRLIFHITQNNNNYELRKVFLNLVDNDYIIRKKNNLINSYLYIYR